MIAYLSDQLENQSGGSLAANSRKQRFVCKSSAKVPWTANLALFLHEKPVALFEHREPVADQDHRAARRGPSQ